MFLKTSCDKNSFTANQLHLNISLYFCLSVSDLAYIHVNTYKTLSL